MRMPTQEHYNILKISKTATLDELKKAYRKRAFELHPDLHPDNPNANKDFQLLNEAYVVLSAYLSPSNPQRAKANASYTSQQSSRGSSTRTSKESTFFKQKEKAKEEYKSEPRTESHKRTYSRAQSNHERAQSSQNFESKNSQSSADYQNPSQEEVLQDILNDPFARRVYEDIYRSLNDEEGQNFSSPFTQERKKKSSTFNMKWIKDKIKSKTNPRNNEENEEDDYEKEESASPVKTWLKNQIDESIEYYLPIQSLFPRARIRLQIGKAFSSEKRTVEITLPSDFIIGKPIRLAGLGRKVGKWQGDLYITFLPSAEE